MAETVPGGATLRADGKTWQDAEGRPLKPEQVAEVEKLMAAQQAERDRQEAANAEAALARDPAAAAFVRALATQQQREAASKPQREGR